ncbi:aspartyl-phosphate phosphatase Spo0E family protein [uncultured Clostridium sp.]|uniref:aspartyl-phosphate phosphatase Spo0E family protein n=1 Tax=uncultured Clostridium sp. TaxID=59620 RepID=UPI0025ED6054|nr:aspartyl-phosphate phosphatase Spo0E family protein [uncultured Clostridium sp.]
MKELREKLHQAIDEYRLTDERTVAISQELDKVVCQAQKLIAKEGLDYIEAVEKAKELIGSERVGAHVDSDSINSKEINDSITEN